MNQSLVMSYLRPHYSTADNLDPLLLLRVETFYHR